MNFNDLKKKKQHLINEEITFSQVLLVNPDGANLTMEISEALSLAQKQELDLVLINDKSNPPVVKILDYGKFLYELKKNQSGKRM